MGKRLSRRDRRRLIIIMLSVWLVLGVIGCIVGIELAPDGSQLASGLVGIAFGSFLWVMICWIAGFVLRGALIRRGYDVPGRNADS